MGLLTVGAADVMHESAPNQAPEIDATHGARVQIAGGYLVAMTGLERCGWMARYVGEMGVDRPTPSAYSQCVGRLLGTTRGGCAARFRRVPCSIPITDGFRGGWSVLGRWVAVTAGAGGLGLHDQVSVFLAGW